MPLADKAEGGMTYLTPLKAIRRKCLQCAGSKGTVRKCTDHQCPLHNYRMGRNPSRQGIGNFNPGVKKSNSLRDSNKVISFSSQTTGKTRSPVLGHSGASRLRLVGAEAGA